MYIKKIREPLETKETIVHSSKADNNYIQEKLREYNAQYMYESRNFNFHIKENGG